MFWLTLRTQRITRDRNETKNVFKSLGPRSNVFRTQRSLEKTIFLLILTHKVGYSLWELVLALV